MKKRRRLKKNVKYFLIGFISIIILLIIIISSIVKRVNYLHSYDYKLGKIGYSKTEIAEIKKLDSKNIDILLDKDYNKLIVKLIKQKYFIFKNLDKYMKYFKESDNDDLAYTISMVNVGADKDYYDNVVASNISDDKLMIVNKYHNLTKDYAPNDLVNVSSIYGYGENQLRKEFGFIGTPIRMMVREKRDKDN